MPITNQQIHNEIMNQVNSEGGPYSSWYVGIASDPRQRLFGDHSVPRENSWWIFREAFSEEDARITETFLLENYGFDGGSSGGDSNTRYVYAYKKIPGVTRQ